MGNKHSMSEKVEFIAELVFEKEPDWCAIEPHFLIASHPEIAYQLALAKGREGRGSKRFVGLSELKENKANKRLFARMEKRNATDVIVAKDKLSAFQDSRWIGVAVDSDELRTSLRDTDVIVELDGLGDITWEKLTHAYGSAQDVPLNLRRLASFDQEVRETALFNLIMTIFHQETLYPATAAAIPSLLKLASLSQMPNRIEIMEFLNQIVKECRFESLIDTKRREKQDDPVSAIHDALWKDVNTLYKLKSDENSLIGDMATYILEEIKKSIQFGK